MADGPFPVDWKGLQAVVTLPEHIDVSNAGQFRDQLLTIINRGAGVLIVDMTMTASCDHAGMDAIARAYQRAAVSGAQLRLVVAAPVISRLVSIEGLDRLVSVYPSVEAALAARTLTPDNAASVSASARANGQPAALASEPRMATITPAVLWQLIDALGDGLALTGDDGKIVLVNWRCAEMFGYERGELTGRQIDSLVPASLRGAHRGYRASYAQAPQARPMGERARLVALRKDGATLPVEISLSPVPTQTGHFVLAVIRDATEARRRQDLADLARAAAAEQTYRGQKLLDRIVQHLFEVGLSLQVAVDLPGEVARERITEALDRLDDTIHDIRDCAFASRRESPTTDPDRPGSAT